MKFSNLPDGIPVLQPWPASHATTRGVLHGIRLGARRRAVERPPLVHPPLARAVGEARQRSHHRCRPQELALLIPSVVGRHGDDRTWLMVAVAVAARAILDVPEATQRVLSGGLLQLNSCVPTPSPIWPQPGGRLSSRSSWFPAQSRGSSGWGCETG